MIRTTYNESQVDHTRIYILVESYDIYGMLIRSDRKDWATMEPLVPESFLNNHTITPIDWEKNR